MVAGASPVLVPAALAPAGPPAQASHTAALGEEHPTAIVYLDESGVIKTDRFFGIGCLKAVDGPALTRALRRHRQVLECMQELHWSRFDKAMSRNDRSFELAFAAMDTFFELDGVSFCCMLADRKNGDLTKSYRSSWHAFEGLSSHALGAAIVDDELVSVIADHVDTPRHVRFEEGVKATVNEEKERLAVATVTRAHSHAIDGLQLTDLLLGAAMFDFRQGALRGSLDPNSQKGRLCSHLLDRCGIPSFRPRGNEVAGKMKVELRPRRRTRRRRRGGDSS
jgi:hypothetical protein